MWFMDPFFHFLDLLVVFPKLHLKSPGVFLSGRLGQEQLNSVCHRKCSVHSRKLEDGRNLKYFKETLFKTILKQANRIEFKKVLEESSLVIISNIKKNPSS